MLASLALIDEKIEVCHVLWPGENHSYYRQRADVKVVPALTPSTRIPALLMVLCEVGIATGVMVVGTYFIITEYTVGLVIEATVALVFLNDIDNFYFEFAYPEVSGVMCW